MSYTDTFIEVADDCPAMTGIVPEPRDGKPTIAVLEYELLANRPYRLTNDELLLIVHVTRLGLSPAELKARGEEIRAELFSKAHPCMRASPLPKRYGWGVHYDEAGRLAIHARGSHAYEALSSGARKAGTVLKAMRSARVS